MHRILTGVLGLLALYFAADHARLQDRNRFLEDKLAAARNVRPARPAPILPEVSVAREIPVEAPAPVAVAAVEVPARAPLEESVGSLSPVTLQDASGAVQGLTQFVIDENPFSRLNLTPDQKSAVDILIARRDAILERYQLAMNQAGSDADAAILRWLTPEQQSRYLARQGIVDVQLTQDVPVEQEPASALPEPGFLGVSGANAEGGGVTFSEIIANTAASGAGLLVGDTLLEFNNQRVPDYKALQQMIQSLPTNSPVNLKIRRNGVEFTQAVLLGGRR